MNLLKAMMQRVRLEIGHWQLPHPKARGYPRSDAWSADVVQRALEEGGLTVTPLRVELAEYRAYLERAAYAQFSNYYAVNQPAFAEKSLEHFLAAQLLLLRPGTTYIDIASDTSPTPDIYAKLFGVRAYRQDLRYPTGVHDDRIGGDAAAMPVPDGFADAMALHCSFEHFEGDSDSRFVTECARVLRPGGRVCILPLYLSATHVALTDPTSFGRSDRPTFDADATVHTIPGWGHRHARQYGPAQLFARVLSRTGTLRTTIYRVTNAQEVDPRCYLQFAMVLEQRA